LFILFLVTLQKFILCAKQWWAKVKGGHSTGHAQRSSYIVCILDQDKSSLSSHCDTIFCSIPGLKATSALDARSEYHINQALQAMAKGRSVISIAHRLSTIQEADLMAVLKGGEIVDTGTFDELIRKAGIS